jgi:hypothetical protein
MRVGRRALPWDIPGVDIAALIRIERVHQPLWLRTGHRTARLYQIGTKSAARTVRQPIAPRVLRPRHNRRRSTQRAPDTTVTRRRQHMATPTPGTAGRSRSARHNDGYVRPIAGALNLAADHVDVINRSHDRCTAHGLSRIERPDLGLLGRADLEIARSRNLRLHQHAAPVMELLYDQIVNTHSMVVLTDATGTIVHAIGDDDFLTRASKIALYPGAVWSEANKGTNAVGTALITEVPTLTNTSFTPTTFSPARRCRSSTRAATCSACSMSRATTAATTSIRWRWSRCRRA